MARIGITEIKGVDGFTDFKLEARDLIKYTEKENSIPLFSIGTLVKFNDGECFILYSDLQKIKHVLYKESLNSLILEILRNYVARHKDDIEKFDRQKAGE